MTTLTDTVKKKKLSTEENAVKAISALLSLDEDFEAAFAAVLNALKSQVKEAWYERRIRTKLAQPLQTAMQTQSVRRVLQAIYTDADALKLIQQLHDQWVASQPPPGTETTPADETAPAT